jgi:polygalacturonase
LTVYNHVNRNNDMINVDCCRNVRISDCLGTSGDDAITLKSTADKPCENVVVTNCTVSSNCNAIKLGTETNGGFKNVTISNCTVSRPVNGYFGNRSLSGIALMIVDGGTMEGVTISNIAMEGVKSAIFIRLGNRARPFKDGMEKPGIGALRNVTISNIEARNVENTGCFVAGLPDFPVENVSINNARIAFVGGGTEVDEMWAVPENAEKYPEGTMFGMLPAYGFYCRHVRGLTFTNVLVAYDAPDPRPALVCDDVENIVLDGFRGQCQPDGAAFTVMKDTKGALIRGSVAPESCPAFLRLETGCADIVAIANDLVRAESPFTFADGVDQTVLHAQANRLD